MNTNLCVKLRELRLTNGYKQKEVARYIGVNESAISAYETNLRKPTYENLIKLAEFYGVTIDFLLGVEKYPKDIINNLTGWRRSFINNVAELLLYHVSEIDHK